MELNFKVQITRPQISYKNLFCISYIKGRITFITLAILGRFPNQNKPKLKLTSVKK